MHTSVATLSCRIISVHLCQCYVEFPGKRLALLKETVSQSAHIAVLVHPALVTYKPRMNNLTVAARALGLHLHVVEVRSAEELDTTFTAMTREGADALIVMSEPVLMDSLLGRVADLAATSRLPAMYDWKKCMWRLGA